MSQMKSKSNPLLLHTISMLLNPFERESERENAEDQVNKETSSN